MSNESNEQDQANPIDSKAVADFLYNNPEFFIDQNELLEKITIPHESGEAISLLERQVIILRKRANEQSTRIHNLLANAEANDALFEKTRTLILSLLKCDNLTMLSRSLNEELGKLFDSVESHLFFVTNHPEIFQGLAVKSYSDAESILGEFFAQKRTHCGPLKQEQARFFFPDKPESLASAAIVPIHMHSDQENPGRNDSAPALLPMLVAGSDNPEYFHSSQDTLFLDFIGEILAALIHNLLPSQ